VGIKRGASWARDLQLVALTFQLLGAIVFVGAELMTGCMNLVPFGKPGCLPDLSLYTAFYFYFGVTLNFVWVLIPTLMIAGIVRSSAAETKHSKRA
jgi:hypothetical protein